MQSVTKRFLLLMSLVITITIMLLCTESDNPFRDTSNVDLIISVPEKEGGLNYCINEEVKFKVIVLLPHLVKKIKVNFSENDKTDEREITTNKSDNKEIYFEFEYKETGMKNVLFTISFRDSDDKKEKFYSIDIGRLPKIRNGGNLVTAGDIMPGKRLILTVDHEEFSSTTYKWYKDKTLIEETEKQSIIFNPLKESDAGEYYCIVRTKWGEEKSNIFKLYFKNYMTPPKILIHPQDVQATPGNSTTFLISAEGDEIKYQWQKDEEVIVGANDDSYKIEDLKMGDDAKYRCIVSNKGGADTSDNASLEVIKNETPPEITKQPENQEAFVEDTVRFTIEAKGTNIQYKWFKNDKVIDKAVSTILEIGPVSIDDNLAKFHCVVSNNKGNATSNEAVLTIKNVEKPEIIGQPKDASVNVGQPATFEFNVKGDKLTFQWFKNGDPIGKATDKLYIIESTTMDDHGKTFKCTAVNPGGEVTSSEVTLTVIKKSAKPVITSQPDKNGVTVTEGSNAVFEISVSGDDLTFQWWKGNEEINGANGSTYTYKNVKIGDDGLKFYCVISNEAGDKVTSDKIVLKVSKDIIAPKITKQPQKTTLTIKENEYAEFSIDATGTDLSFQWYRNNDEISNAKSDSYRVKAKRELNGSKFHCIVKNSKGDEKSEKVELNIRLLIEVTFDMDGGDGNASSEEVYQDDEVKLPKNIEKEGHIFEGWSDGKGNYDPGGSYTVKGDDNIEFKAKWKIKSFDVTLEDYPKPGKSENKRIEYLEPMRLPTPNSAEGYKFKGWEDESGDRVSGSIEIKKKCKFTAQWDKESYDVILEDYPKPGKSETKRIEFDKPMRLPTPSSIEGWEFEGWEDEGGDPVSGSITITRHREFTAKWKQKMCTLTKVNGGNETTEDHPYGSKVTLPDLKSTSEMEFVGWKVGRDIVKSFTIYNDVIAIAQWKKKAEEWIVKYTSFDQRNLPVNETVKVTSDDPWITLMDYPYTDEEVEGSDSGDWDKIKGWYRKNGGGILKEGARVEIKGNETFELRFTPSSE